MFDEEQIVWKLRKIAEELEKDSPVLGDEICDVIQMIEAQQGKVRRDVRVRIEGIMSPLLQHVIQLKTLEHNNIEPPKNWEKEIKGFVKNIVRLNKTSKFRSGFFFTEKELQSISADEMEYARENAEDKLEDGWPDAKIPEEVQKAKQAEDLGITF